jgi:hypothetical protein
MSSVAEQETFGSLGGPVAQRMDFPRLKGQNFEDYFASSHYELCARSVTVGVLGLGHSSFPPCKQRYPPTAEALGSE